MTMYNHFYRLQWHQDPQNPTAESIPVSASFQAQGQSADQTATLPQEEYSDHGENMGEGQLQGQAVVVHMAPAATFPIRYSQTFGPVNSPAYLQDVWVTNPLVPSSTPSPEGPEMASKPPVTLPTSILPQVSSFYSWDNPQQREEDRLRRRLMAASTFRIKGIPPDTSK